jgi:hypothetical protein
VDRRYSTLEQTVFGFGVHKVALEQRVPRLPQAVTFQQFSPTHVRLLITKAHTDISTKGTLFSNLRSVQKETNFFCFIVKDILTTQTTKYEVF